MPEPTSTAAGIATVAVYAGATSAITAFGVPLGLRADLLFIAGFAGSLVAIILLNTVPGTGDGTWQQLARTTWRRMAVACASSLTADYLTPLAMLVAQLPEALLLGGAFAVGGGAQQVLTGVIRRLSGPPASQNPQGGTQYGLAATHPLHCGPAGAGRGPEQAGAHRATAPGLKPRERATEWLKAVAWSLLALGGAGAVISPRFPFLPARARAQRVAAIPVARASPTLPDVCVIVGFAVLIVRTRVQEG